MSVPSDPNNTTANPLPPGMTQAQYYAALAAGGQNATAAAGAAGNTAANTAFATDPNDSANPNSAAGQAATPALSVPGPGEIYDAANSGDFNTPGATETAYSIYGQDPLKNKSDAQTLFEEGTAGSDPFYNNAQTVANKAINDAASARGGWNSGAAMQAIGNSTANIRGQQAQSLYALAPQADAAEQSRIALGFNLANQNDTAEANRVGAGMGINDDWQNQQDARLGGALSTATTLGNDKADTTSAAYKSALDTYNTDGLAGIEAALQKAGINPTGDATKDFITLAGIGAKASAAS